jgi:hypothetical protein
LKENQANQGIVKATATETEMVMAVRKNVRQDVLTIGLAMVFVMSRALTLLVTMMMVTAQPQPQLICQQHLLQRSSRRDSQRNSHHVNLRSSRRGSQRNSHHGNPRGNQRRSPLHICKEVQLPDQ